MKTAKSRAISAERLNELRAEAREDLELQAFFEPGDRLYSLADGRALSVLRDGRARVWSSRSDVLAMFRELRDGPQITHVLQPYGFTELFPRETPFWIDRLACRMGVDSETINPAPRGMEWIQSTISEKDARDLIKPGTFEGLVALVGEALLAAELGRWEMVEERDCNVWEPTIRLGNGKVKSVGVDLYDELRVNGRNAVLIY